MFLIATNNNLLAIQISLSSSGRTLNHHLAFFNKLKYIFILGSRDSYIINKYIKFPSICMLLLTYSNIDKYALYLVHFCICIIIDDSLFDDFNL